MIVQSISYTLFWWFSSFCRKIQVIDIYLLIIIMTLFDEILLKLFSELFTELLKHINKFYENQSI